MFGLITYNSFAAFVTSVLSVLDNPIRDIDDLILSEMKFGYAVESPEEIYLRVSKCVTLKSPSESLSPTSLHS